MPITQYGFMAELDDDEDRIQLADEMGGGTTIDAHQLREDIVSDIRDYIQRMSHEYAVAIVDDLNVGLELEGDD